jgi:hypothetical protein
VKIPPRPDDLLVLNGNFGHFNLVRRMVSEGRPFFIRMSTGISNFGKGVVADGRMDFVTEWVPCKSESETSKTSAPIQVGVTKAVLKTDETEILVSIIQNLELFNKEDLVELDEMGS